MASGQLTVFLLARGFASPRSLQSRHVLVKACSFMPLTAVIAV